MAKVGVVKVLKNKTTMMITIAAPFQRLLKWLPGDYVTMTVEGDQLVVTNVQRRLVEIAPRHRREERHGEAE